MTVVWQDGFDHYGDDGVEGVDVAVNRALQMNVGGVAMWASIDGCYIGDPGIDTSPAAPAAARTGRGALRVDPTSSGSTLGARAVLPNTETEAYFHFGLFVQELSETDGIMRILELRSSANAFVGELKVSATGQLVFISEGGATLYTSAQGTITPGVWHQLQVKVIKSATVGVLEIRLNGVVLTALTNQNTGATAIGGFRFRFNGAGANDLGANFWIDDIVVTDNSGTYNQGFLGDVRVATLYPRADDETGWTPNTRHKYGNGILQLNGSNGLTCADNVQFEFGSGDFTMECFARFLATPTGSNHAVLFGKWREGTNARSYRLFLGGPSVNNGHLEFQISTDGTAGTVASIASSEFTPVRDHWYHIVVQRKSGEVIMFADGVPLNAPEADANTYHDNTSLFTVGAQQNTAATLTANTGVNGFLEEVRITKGVARYNNSGFVAPTAAFGRNVGADASYNSVSLLLGFDTGIIDESSFARAVTAISGAARYAPQDAQPGDYKTVNNVDPLDDTGMEAPYTPAQNTLTFTGQPANNDTITVDGNVYTFKTVFVDVAGNVLIGASVSDSIDNLVAAINGDAGAGTLYGTGTTASDEASALNIDNNQMRVSANTGGTAGNAITATESCANAAWADTGGTLVGGLNIPGPSSFFLTRLPPQTTGIKAITLLARARKSDTGPAKIQNAFVTADGSSANGVAHAITTSDGYYGDVIEEDPSTTNALTPSSFIGARFRIDRTE